jgi:hypothetical protein
MAYMVTIAGDELFKKMQVWTIKADKVYVITYSAQAALYSNYLPMAQKMVESFAFIPGTHEPTLSNTNHPSVTTNKILPPAPPTGLLPPLSR